MQKIDLKDAKQNFSTSFSLILMNRINLFETKLSEMESKNALVTNKVNVLEKSINELENKIVISSSSIPISSSSIPISLSSIPSRTFLELDNFKEHEKGFRYFHIRRAESLSNSNNKNTPVEHPVNRPNRRFNILTHNFQQGVFQRGYKWLLTVIILLLCFLMFIYI
jgi:hypothetical protein